MRARSWFVALAVGAVAACLRSLVRPLSPPLPAPGGPGALSHFDQARKDCLGTARNTTSKIWYTVANGVLSDVYAPTIDTTNVETMQYVVTDGSTFTDLQTRDTTYTVAPTRPAWCARSPPRPRAGATGSSRPTSPTPTATASWSTPVPPAHRGRRARQGLRPARRDRRRQRRRGHRQRRRRHRGRRHLHRLAGAGLLRHQHRDQRGQPRLRGARPSSRCAPTGRSAVSSGFVGTASDGLTQLDAAHALTPVDPDGH